MPNTSSAKKALRQNVRRRAENLVRKDSLKTAVKAVKKAVTAKNGKQVQIALTTLYKTADKIAKSGFIKQNKAARLKSRATKFATKALAK